MFSNVVVALAASVGVGIWVFRKFSQRASGGEFSKTITPAIIAGILVFIFMLVTLSAVL